MSTVLICFAAFVVAYAVNMTWVSVLYHRGLAHGAVALSPRMRRIVGFVGPWFTGMDAKTWVCMHRLHHTHSDAPDDPHSPRNVGLLGVVWAQLRSYERVMHRLVSGDPVANRLVADLDFPVAWANRKGLWLAPYVLHGGIAVGLSLATGIWPLGIAYWLGLMSHPLQGWAVNALGHAVGKRRFATPDDSRNNRLVAWLVFGEGLQNNHHAHPRSARFSAGRGEVDPGYWATRVLEILGILEVRREYLIGAREPQAPIAPAAPGRAVTRTPLA